jgi:hypothetical protein
MGQGFPQLLRGHSEAVIFIAVIALGQLENLLFAAVSGNAEFNSHVSIAA